jgi:Trypsin
MRLRFRRLAMLGLLMTVLGHALSITVRSSPPATAAARVTSGQADVSNRFANVGVLLVWVDPNPFGVPEGLLGFCSGVLVHERVFLTAGHCTGPAAFGTPPFFRVSVSFAASHALDQSTWIPVEQQFTHPSVPPCPPPTLCDPTTTNVFTAGDPSITDLGLVVLKVPVVAIAPADFAPPGTLERREAVQDPMTFVGYGFPSRAADGGLNPLSEWSGVRHFGSSWLDVVLNDVWAAWSLPGLVCQGDSGGATFVDADLNGDPKHDKLVAIASDGGTECGNKDLRTRVDTVPSQHWIKETIKAALRGKA